MPAEGVTGTEGVTGVEEVAGVEGVTGAEEATGVEEVTERDGAESAWTDMGGPPSVPPECPCSTAKMSPAAARTLTGASTLVGGTLRFDMLDDARARPFEQPEDRMDVY
ncbi:hypothetical protein ACFVUY_26655 [Kitasatospora sp. NPDC058063]|uniref:hypothetical protein n=1 Tax=unclassified Kitasatospora TaxID=2633591 RepID=UPI0036DD0FD9